MYSAAEMEMFFGLMAKEKEQWLNRFSTGPNRRPEWNLKQERDRLKALQQAEDAYRKLAERNPSHVHSQSR